MPPHSTAHAPPNRALGHWPERRQPTASSKLNLPSVRTEALDALDDWLWRNFNVTSPAPSSSHAETHERLANRVFALAQRLLTQARIPAFELGRLATPADQRPTASDPIPTVDLPCAGRLLRGVTAQVHRQSAELIDAWQRGELDGLSPDDVCQRVENSIINPALAIVPSGKSTLALLEAAHALDLPLIYQGNGQYQVGHGVRSRLLLSSSVDSDSAIGARQAQNKRAGALKLNLAGLPGPTHLPASHLDQALAAAAQLKWPLVVKPVDRDRGEGVTVNIRDEAGLTQAFVTARALSPEVLIERMAPGICHRLLLVNNELVYAVQRQPKSVVGNGIDSVRELVAQRNAEESVKHRWSRLRPFPMDELATRLLQEQGLRWESVPESGLRVLLRPTQTADWGGDIVDMTHRVHPDNLDVARRAARLFGLEVAGIDLISSDIATPWYANGAVINEINPTPMIGGSALLHHRTIDVIRQLLPQGGRIPVRAIVGGPAAWERVKLLQSSARSEGRRCYATSHAASIGPEGQALYLRGITLIDRCHSLLMERTMDELVLVVSTDEVLRFGAPIDRLDEVFLHDTDLRCGATGALLGAEVAEATAERLKPHLH